MSFSFPQTEFTITASHSVGLEGPWSLHRSQVGAGDSRLLHMVPKNLCNIGISREFLVLIKTYGNNCYLSSATELRIPPRPFGELRAACFVNFAFSAKRKGEQGFEFHIFFAVI